MATFLLACPSGFHAGCFPSRLASPSVDSRRAFLLGFPLIEEAAFRIRGFFATRWVNIRQKECTRASVSSFAIMSRVIMSRYGGKFGRKKSSIHGGEDEEILEFSNSRVFNERDNCQRIKGQYYARYERSTSEEKYSEPLVTNF